MYMGMYILMNMSMKINFQTFSVFNFELHYLFFKRDILCEISTPVILVTVSGILSIMLKTSWVNLEAPSSLLPSEIIVIFLAFVNGAATSAATLGNI